MSPKTFSLRIEFIHRGKRVWVLCESLNSKTIIKQNLHSLFFILYHLRLHCSILLLKLQSGHPPTDGSKIRLQQNRHKNLNSSQAD